MKGFVATLNEWSQKTEYQGIVTLNQNVSLNKDNGWAKTYQSREITKDPDTGEFVEGEMRTKRYKLASCLIGDKNVPIQLNVSEKTIDNMIENEEKFVKGEKYLATIQRLPSTTQEGKTVFLGRLSNLQSVPTDNDALEALWQDSFGNDTVEVKAKVKAEPLTVDDEGTN